MKKNVRPYNPSFADPWRTYTHQLERFVSDLCRITTIKAAAGIASPDGELTLLHVIDQSFLDEMATFGLGEVAELSARLRERAETSFKTSLEGIDTGAAIYPEEWPAGGGPSTTDPNRKVVS